MKKPSNKVISIYLIWTLIHFALLLSQISDIFKYGGKVFYPFTKGRILYGDYGEGGNVYTPIFYKNNWDVRAYDLSEFTFYIIIAPILIYYAVLLWNKAPKE